SDGNARSMKSTRARGWRRSFAEMTTNRVAHHLAQFLDGLPLRGDGVTEGGGDKSPVDLVLAHFKNDLAHLRSLAPRGEGGQGATFLALVVELCWGRPSLPSPVSFRQPGRAGCDEAAPLRARRNGGWPGA